MFNRLLEPKLNEPCNYCGADFLFGGKFDDYILLKTPNKNLSDKKVSWRDKDYIRKGFCIDKRYKSRQR